MERKEGSRGYYTDPLFQQYNKLKEEQKKSRKRNVEFTEDMMATLADLNQQLGLKYSAWNPDFLVAKSRRPK